MAPRSFPAEDPCASPPRLARLRDLAAAGWKKRLMAMKREMEGEREKGREREGKRVEKEELAEST